MCPAIPSQVVDMIDAEMHLTADVSAQVPAAAKMALQLACELQESTDGRAARDNRTSTDEPSPHGGSS